MPISQEGWEIYIEEATIDESTRLRWIKNVKKLKPVLKANNQLEVHQQQLKIFPKWIWQVSLKVTQMHHSK